jgi:hypothetical protein
MCRGVHFLLQLMFAYVVDYSWTYPLQLICVMRSFKLIFMHLFHDMVVGNLGIKV